MPIRPGDIVEIRTAKGLAYAIYTHRYAEPPKYGALIRVFEGLHRTRPEDLNALTKSSVQFSTFFPLGSAVHRKIVTVIGNVPVPPELQPFPVFRSGVPHPHTKKVEQWWLWDGNREWRIGNLTPEQRKLPIRGVWNYTLLVNRIESGWRAETAEW